MLQVGTVVRASRPGTLKATGQAVVATEPDDDDENVVCLLWEPLHPKPIRSSFLIAPKFKPNQSEEEVEELTISVDSVQALLPFEQEDNDREQKTTLTIADYKSRGDQLLKLGDASAAIPYYEAGLSKSHCIEIGGSCILAVQGFPQVAEIDCIDDDSVDVELVASGEERSVKPSQILIAILQDDPEQLQERILLNLSRCLLQVAELSPATRPNYLKAAVLACSLVISIAQFHSHSADEDNNEALPNTAQTALQLRAKAQASLGKWKNARSDSKLLLKQAGNEQQGQRLLHELERQQRIQVKSDKKLAKEVCKWVDTATKASVSEEDIEEEEDKSHSKKQATETSDTHSNSHNILQWMIILPIAVSILIHFLIRKTNEPVEDSDTHII